MDSSNFLILGANGQLGRALSELYPDAKKTDIAELDITNVQSVENYDWGKVTTILNAAGYTNVDGAETPQGRELAFKVNAKALENLGRTAIDKDLVVVHISTDYVFDGTKNPHTEDETFNPLSVYGKSKMEGDIQVANIPKHYILRTSWVVGDGPNFVRTMLDLAKTRESLDVVCDQVGRPTFATELARAIDHLLKTKPDYGTYNVSNSGPEVSWAEFAKAIFTEAGLKTSVNGITAEEYAKKKPDAAHRPANSTFDLSKIESTGFSPRDWRQDLKEYISKESSK